MVAAASRHRSPPTMRGGGGGGGGGGSGRPISSSYRRKQADNPMGTTSAAAQAAAAAAEADRTSPTTLQQRRYSSSPPPNTAAVSSPTALTHSVPRPRSPRSPRSAAAARRRELLTNKQQQQPPAQQPPPVPQPTSSTNKAPSTMTTTTTTRSRSVTAILAAADKSISTATTSGATSSHQPQPLLSALRFSQEVHTPRLVSSMRNNNNNNNITATSTTRRNSNNNMDDYGPQERRSNASAGRSSRRSRNEMGFGEAGEKSSSDTRTRTSKTTSTTTATTPTKERQQRYVDASDDVRRSYERAALNSVEKDTYNRPAQSSTAPVPRAQPRSTSSPRPRQPERRNRSLSPPPPPPPAAEGRRRRRVAVLDDEDEDEDEDLDSKRERDRDRDAYRRSSSRSRRGSKGVIDVGGGGGDDDGRTGGRNSSNSRGRGVGGGESRSSSSRKSSRRSTPGRARDARGWRETAEATRTSTMSLPWKTQQHQEQDVTSVSSRNTYTSTTGGGEQPSLETGLRGLLRGGRLVGSRMAECVHVAANVYTQECHTVKYVVQRSDDDNNKSQKADHGHDDLFFQNHFKSLQEQPGGILFTVANKHQTSKNSTASQDEENNNQDGEEDDIRILHTPDGGRQSELVRALSCVSEEGAEHEAAAAATPSSTADTSKAAAAAAAKNDISMSNSSIDDRTADFINPHHHSPQRNTKSNVEGLLRPPPILLKKTRGDYISSSTSQIRFATITEQLGPIINDTLEVEIDESDNARGGDKNDARYQATTALADIDSQQQQQQVPQHDLSKVLPLSRTSSELRDLRALRLQMFAHDRSSTNGQEQPKQELLLQELEHQLTQAKAAMSRSQQEQQQAQEKAQELQERPAQTTTETDSTNKSVDPGSVVHSDAAFQRQIQVQEKLRRELQNNDKLLDQISFLKEETMRLKTRVRSAKADARRAEIRASSPSADSSQDKDEELSHSSSSKKSVSMQRRTPGRSYAATPPKRRLDKQDDNSPVSVMDGPLATSDGESSASRSKEARAPDEMAADRHKEEDGSLPQRDQQQDDNDHDVSHDDDNNINTRQVHMRSPERYVTFASRGQQQPRSPSRSPSGLLMMRAEVIDLRAQLAEAHATRLQAEHRTAELERDNHHVREETRQLREEVAELKRLVQDLTTVSTSGAKGMDMELESVRKQLGEWEKATTDHALEKEKLQNDLADTRREAETLRSQLAHFMADVNGNESAFAQQLEEQVTSMKEKNEKLDHELQQARNDTDKLRLEIVRCKNEIKDAKASTGLLELEEQLLNMKKTNSELELRYKQQIGRFISEISQAKRDAEDRMKSKDQETRKLEAQVFSANVTKERLEEELTMSQSETDSFREEAARFLTELEALKLESSDAERLRQEVERMKDEKGKLEEELTETQTEASRLKVDVARFMQELEKSENQRKTGDERIKVSEEEGRKLQATVREMKAKLAQSNAEVVQQASEHLKQRQMMEEELAQTQITSQALLRKVVILDDQIVRAETEADRLRAILEAQESEPGALYPSPTFAESIKSTFSDVTESWTGRGSPVEGRMIVPEDGQRNSILTRLRGALEYHR